MFPSSLINFLKALENILQMDIYLRSILPNVFQNNYCLYPMSDSSKVRLDSKIYFSEHYSLVAEFYFGWNMACMFLAQIKVFGGVAEKSDSDNWTVKISWVKRIKVLLVGY